MKMIFKSKWLTILIILVIGLSIYEAIQYFILGANSSGLVKNKLRTMHLDSLWYVMLYAHIATAMTAICTGCFQFSNYVRTKSIRTHRLMGKIYSYCVIVSGIIGIYLSFYATGGLVSTAAFLLMSLSWLYTIIKGIRAIVIKKDRIEHQRWMYRNYALTLGAVTLRIYLPLCMLLFGFEVFDDYYRVIAWLSWVPNLIVAEWILNRMHRKNNSKPLSTPA